VNVLVSIAASHHSFSHADPSVLPNYGWSVARPDEILEPNAAADEEESDRATSELLRGVRDSTGAPGPLKSVAGYLCLILDNCQVWLPSHTSDSQSLRSF